MSIKREFYRILQHIHVVDCLGITIIKNLLEIHFRTWGNFGFLLLELK